MNTVTANHDGWTIIGRQGENERTIVRFPAAEVFLEYPEAEVVILHQRHGDPSAYPVNPVYVAVSAEDRAVEWLIISGDVAQVGRGQAQLDFMVGNTVVKTMIYTTNTLPSLGGGEVPEPWESWVKEILRSNAAAMEAAEKLQVADVAETMSYVGLPYHETEDPDLAEAVHAASDAETLGYLGIENYEQEEGKHAETVRAATEEEILEYLGI